LYKGLLCITVRTSQTKQTTLKLIYCSYSAIPSKTANSIAVMKQCAALARKNALTVILIQGKLPGKYDKLYGVPKMNVILLPSFMLWFNELGLRLYVTLYALMHKDSIVYSRDVFINSTLCRFRVPNYYEIHQLRHQRLNNFNKRFQKSLNIIARSTFTRKIICISNKLKNECVSIGIPKDKLNVLHSGVDLSDSLSKNAQIEIPLFDKTQPVAIYAGSLQRGKGIDTIVAMAHLASNYNFLIVGGEKGDIHELVNLRHIPFVSHPNVMKLLESADFLLLPMEDNDCQYHSPLKLFEYLAAGKVLIASDIDDIREIIVNEQNGMLAEPSNPHSFIEKMETVSSDMELRSRIEENAIKTANNFSWEHRSESILKIIKQDFEYEKY